MPDFDEVADAIRGARWKTQLVGEDEDGDRFATTLAKAKAADKNIYFNNSIYSGERYTEKELADVLKENTEVQYTFEDVDGDSVTVQEEEYRKLLRRRETRVLLFEAAGFDILLGLDGTLKVGCQTHSLTVWESDEGANIMNQEGYWDDDADSMYANRDKVFALLRDRIAREKARLARVNRSTARAA